MAASADKVQYILETLLEESIALVKRGIFSQLELREMMHRREKCENAMLKKTYKVTDYLGAIEYEYQLERQRRSRMDQIAKVEDGHTNPAFRKQSSADFVIVKRIIRLWDRTMHKYKFKLHLWKQYLKFCITISSKKHFYKALTNALRFLPFQLDLWKIGVEYQKDIGHNLWKARKILIKAMKLVPSGSKNVELGEYMIHFQIDFLKALLHRREIIVKGEEAMKFVGQNEGEEEQSDKEDREAMDSIDLNQYDQMIWIIIEEIFNKNQNNQVQSLTYQNLRNNLLNLLVELHSKNTNQTIKQILDKVIKRLNLEHPSEHVKLENEVLIEEQIDLEQEEANQNELAIGRAGCIDFSLVQPLIKERCLKPQALSQVYEQMLDMNFDQAVHYIVNHKRTLRLPTPIILSLLTRFDALQNQHDYGRLQLFLQAQIDKLQPKDYRSNINLLRQVTKFNSNQSRLQITTRIMRSICIHYKSQPQFLEVCNKISNAY